MSIRLRAHHLLCILTFANKGYSTEFITNLARIVAQIADGESIILVDGPDDVCAPLKDSNDRHCVEASVLRRDREAYRAIANSGIDRVCTTDPLLLDAAAVSALRVHFGAGSIRAACMGCTWYELCSDIAAADFSSAVLHPLG